MARNNLTWIKGDITGDIYFDHVHIEGKEVQFLRLILMINQVRGSGRVHGLRVCVYGPLAELVYGHVQRGSRLGVIGHIQVRNTRKGGQAFEIVAEEVEFLRNINWEKGGQVHKDLVQRGLLREAFQEQDLTGTGDVDFTGLESSLQMAVPEDVIDEG